MLFLLFQAAEQAAGGLPPWLNHIIALWPIFTAIGLLLAGLLAWRAYEKAGIHKTNAANIGALEGLLETRNKELTEAIAERDDLQERIDVLESEYKALAGLVIADLLIWAGRYDLHKAELDQKDSDLRIANARIKILEDREAELLAIHKSQ